MNAIFSEKIKTIPVMGCIDIRAIAVKKKFVFATMAVLTCNAPQCTLMYKIKCIQGAYVMKTATCTEFRKHAAAYFNEVEKGEEIRIVRHGRTIAIITPAAPAEQVPSWKRPSQGLFLKGTSVSSIILEDREK